MIWRPMLDRSLHVLRVLAITGRDVTQLFLLLGSWSLACLLVLSNAGRHLQMPGMRGAREGSGTWPLGRRWDNK